MLFRSAVENLEALKIQLQEVQKANEEAKLIDQAIAAQIKQNKEIEHNIMLLNADTQEEQNKLQKMKDEFSEEKFKVKKDKEFTERMMFEVQNKIGEADAKMKRLAMEEERIKGMEMSNLAFKQRLDSVMKQMKKLMDEVQ